MTIWDWGKDIVDFKLLVDDFLIIVVILSLRSLCRMLWIPVRKLLVLLAHIGIKLGGKS